MRAINSLSCSSVRWGKGSIARDADNAHWVQFVCIQMHTAGGIDPDVVWAKLASLAQGAAIASKWFWP